MRRIGARWRVALLFAAIAIAATPLWLPAIGLALVVANPLAPADAIVPLAGGPYRVVVAAQLFRAGYGSCFVATDVIAPAPAGRQAESREIARMARALGVPQQQICLTTAPVYSTYSELVAVRELASRQGWRSLILVTSPEHTRRTSLMAGEVFRASGITVITRPVNGYGYDPAHWWHNETERNLTMWEYVKLLVFLVGYR